MCMFQYPLFRIVDCFIAMDGAESVWQTQFQYPLFRIVDCFLIPASSAAEDSMRFNIRSFGSWIASRGA